MIRRTLERYLLRDAQFYPVVTLTGPRQSGKTTLLKAAFPNHEYVSLEEMDTRRFALEDPRGFLARYPGPAIFDEAQRVPELFSYIQSAVDARPAPGLYVLSGSQNFLLMERVAQSLAGRTGVLHLLPFQRAELEGAITVEPDDPHALFNNTATKLAVWDTVFRGFYPRVRADGVPPELWLEDYIRTYVERDLRALIQVGDLERFGRFLALVAGRVGQLLNYSTLADDCGISVDTAKRWVSALVTSFIAFLLPPHHRNLNKRIIKTPKLYFYDTGLASRLLGVRSTDQLFDHPLRGALFENLIVAELAKTYEHHRRKPPLYFWRDQSGHEVDLLIEEQGRLYPVEIKSGQTIRAEMFAGLRWWCAQAGQELATATLIHGGDAFHTQNGVAVRPWYAV